MRDNWTVKRLGEISNIQKGKISDQSEYPKEGFLPIINTDFLRGNIHVWGKIQGSVLSEEDDVLILWDGERSGLSAVGHVGVLGSTFSKIKSDNEIDSNYLYRFIDGKFDWIQNQRTGTGVPHVPKDLDKILKIEYPPLPQQRKIAKILATCDMVIAKTEEALAKYQAIKQGMMHDLFTRGIDINTGKLRPKYQDAPELYKESELGMIPKDWEVKRLGEVGSVKMCKRIFSYQTREEGIIPFYKIGTFGKSPDAHISRELFEEFKEKYSYPSVGSILISASGTIGRLVVYSGEEAYYQDSNIVWIENNEKLISNEFLRLVFPLVHFQTEGGTIQRLYNSILENGLFPCPLDHDEQGLIISKLTSLLKKIDSEQQSLSKYKQIKSGLMEDLLSGKVEVSVSKKEEIINA